MITTVPSQTNEKKLKSRAFSIWAFADKIPHERTCHERARPGATDSTRSIGGQRPSHRRDRAGGLARRGPAGWVVVHGKLRLGRFHGAARGPGGRGGDCQGAGAT